MIRSILFIIAASFFFASCQQCVCLPSDGLRLALVSFNPTDIDTIVIRKFEKGNGFVRIVDTLQWDQTNVTFRARMDTFQMANWVGDIGLKSKFDYEVYVPTLNRRYKITELREPQRQENCPGKIMCMNSIISAKVDEATAIIDSKVLYLHK